MTKLDGETETTSLWSSMGRGMALTGRAVGAGATAMGRSTAWAYHSVAPDLRRQFFQTPLLGLMRLVPTSQHGRDETTEDNGPSRHRDIILVHGLAGHPSNFRGVERYLTHVAGRRSRAIDLRGMACLDEMAEQLRQTIADRCDANGEGTPKQVDLITHSMGGIVARLAMDDPATRARVATLITMGTPHYGTHLARLAETPRTLDLRPDSPIMQRLASQDFWDSPEGPRLIALWSRSDTTILPATSAQWDAAETHHLADFTHLSFLLSPESWRFLARLLRLSTQNLTDPAAAMDSRPSR